LLLILSQNLTHKLTDIPHHFSSKTDQIYNLPTRIAYTILFNPSRSRIKIQNNLLICSDLHSFLIISISPIFNFSINRNKFHPPPVTSKRKVLRFRINTKFALFCSRNSHCFFFHIKSISSHIPSSETIPHAKYSRRLNRNSTLLHIYINHIHAVFFHESVPIGHRISYDIIQTVEISVPFS